MSEPKPRNIETPQMAEHVAMEWMRHWGFHDAKVTPPGPDAGLDVVSQGAVAQVKFYSAQIGRKTLQELVGANYGSSRQMIFFTTSGYSQPAHEYADKASIALFQIRPFGSIQPANTAAERVAAREEERRREREEERQRKAAKREEVRRLREKAQEERRMTDEQKFDRKLELATQQGRSLDGAKQTGNQVDPADPATDVSLRSTILVVLICALLSGLFPRAVGRFITDGFTWGAVITLLIGGVAALIAGFGYFGGIAAQVSRVAWFFGGGLLGAAVIGWWAFADGSGEGATKVLAVLVGLAWLFGFGMRTTTK